MVYVLLVERLFNARCRDTYVDKVFLRKADVWNYIEKQYYDFLNTILHEGNEIITIYITSISVGVFYRNNGDRCYTKYIISEQSIF